MRGEGGREGRLRSGGGVRFSVGGGGRDVQLGDILKPARSRPGRSAGRGRGFQSEHTAAVAGPDAGCTRSLSLLLSRRR